MIALCFGGAALACWVFFYVTVARLWRFRRRNPDWVLRTRWSS